MQKHRGFIASTALAAALLAAAGSAQATIFATITGAGLTISDLKKAHTGTFAGGNALTAFGRSTFSFLVNGLPMNLKGTLRFTNAGSLATATSMTSGGDVFYSQGGYSGSFEEIFAGKTGVYHGVHLISGVSDLLSGRFVDGVITGTDSLHPPKGVGGDFDAKVTSYSSVFPLAGIGSGGDFDIELANRSTRWALDHGVLRTIEATASGSFAAIPEPGAWSLMLLGVGAVGAFARRRRFAAAVG